MPIRFAALAVSFAALSAAACSPKPAETPTPPPAETPASTPAPTPAPVGEVLTADGFGPIRIGMTEQEAWTAYGAAGSPPKADPECHIVNFPNLTGVSAMVEKGNISRVTLREPGPTTDKGLQVGATADQVKAAYGANITSEAHKYEAAPAQYLTTWGVPDKSGLRYEIDHTGKVAAIHGGGPSILYVESCS